MLALTTRQYIHHWTAQFTQLSYDVDVGKRYCLIDGRVHEKVGGNGYFGRFGTRTISSMAALDAMQDSLTTKDCLIAGTSCVDAEFGSLGRVEDRCHQRTKDWFPEPFGCAVVAIDIDREGAPVELQRRLGSAEDVASLLVGLVPEARTAALLIRPSSSNGVLLPNGEPVKTGGWHAFLVAPHGRRVDLMHRLYALFARAGVAWIKVSRAPSLLRRNLVDLALASSNQPIFSAPPHVDAPLRLERPKSFVQEGAVFDPDWLPDEGPEDVGHVYELLKQSPVVQAELADVAAQVADREIPKDSPNRSTLVREKTERLLTRAASLERGILVADMVITFVDGTQASVADILKFPERYHRRLTLTPGEEDYRGGAQTGIIYTDRHPAILHTQAHGGLTYMLLPFDPADLKEPMAEPATSQPCRRLTGLEGQAALARALERWPKQSPKLAVRATMGLGKTRASTALMTTRPGRFLYLTPTASLAKEAFDQFAAGQGLDGWLWKGRFSKVGGDSSELMCLDPQRVDDVLKASPSGQPRVQRDACSMCPLKADCAYQAQVRAVRRNPPRVMFATHDFAHVPFPMEWDPDFVIVDEALRTGGLDRSRASADVPEDAAHDQETAQRHLDEHRQHPPLNAFDVEAFGRWIRKAEVLTAMAAGEPTYYYNGLHVAPRVLEYRYPHKPLLLLDGTFRPELAELYFGPFDEVVRIDVERNMTLVQVVGTQASKYRTINEESFRTAVRDLFSALPKNWMFVTYKGALERLGWENAPNVAWFGGLRGIDRLGECEGGIVFGRNQPPINVLEAEAQVLGKHYGFQVKGLGESYFEDRTIEDKGGAKRKVKVRSHEDPIVRALLGIAREDETLQAVDRLRLVWHEGDPKVVVVVSELPTELEVHKLVEWCDFKDRRLAPRAVHASLTGPMPSSPNQAVSVRPDVWVGKTTAQRDYKNQLRPNWKTFFGSKYILPLHTEDRQRRRQVEVLERPEACIWSDWYRGLWMMIWGARAKGGIKATHFPISP